MNLNAREGGHRQESSRFRLSRGTPVLLLLCFRFSHQLGKHVARRQESADTLRAYGKIQKNAKRTKMWVVLVVYGKRNCALWYREDCCLNSGW